MPRTSDPGAFAVHVIAWGFTLTCGLAVFGWLRLALAR
jgi:hypothetical protein